MTVALLNESGLFASLDYDHSRSVNVAAGSDKLLIVSIAPINTATVSAVKYNGVDMVKASTAADLYLYYLVNPPEGTHNLTFSTSVYVTCLYHASAYSGVNQTTPISALRYNEATSTGLSAVSETVPSGGLLYTSGHHYSLSATPVILEGTGILAYRDAGGGHGIVVGYRDTTGSISWTTASSGLWKTNAVSIYAVGSGADTTRPTLTGSITVSSLTTTSYTLSWPTGADNVAVTAYEYSINGGSTWTSNGTATTVNISGRTPGSTDSVQVRAKDAAGNVSTPVLSASVTLATPTVTVTEPLKDAENGGLMVSQSGIKVAVLRAADLVSVYSATVATDALGLLPPISNVALTTGDSYLVAIKRADGGVGITGAVTAT